LSTQRVVIKLIKHKLVIFKQKKKKQLRKPPLYKWDIKNAILNR